MSRPVNCRRIGTIPYVTRFKPAGKPCRDLESITVTLDEFEAIRLTDLEGLYQTHAAQLMGVSRPTLSRIIESAHSKVADMLVHGKELRIEGGFVRRDDQSGKDCPECTMDRTGRPECLRVRKSHNPRGDTDCAEEFQKKGDML